MDLARHSPATAGGLLSATASASGWHPELDGSERELGISTVTDRLIQQALLQPRIDPGFIEYSHGFCPGRRAHDVVLAAQR